MGAGVIRVNNAQWWAHRAEVVVYLALSTLAIFWTIAKLHWNPVVAIIGFLVTSYFAFNGLHKLVFEEDFGLHNLEGYDPATGTVPSLEVQGFDTKQFWPNPGHPKYRRS